MKRYVSVKRSAAGVTAVTVTLVDGELSASYTAKTYIGEVAAATRTANEYALRQLEEIRVGLEPRIEKAS